ncbi:RNA polymerase sigma factor [Pseudactinotalea sp. Z1748]|uniref:RNA polymerase sigma factor n=1 Tax=Pseudactinotalea sp. Z1748 TaxID=3413027 RepID=UPI003C7D7A8A
MSETSDDRDREDAFRSLFERVYPDLVRFVQRRADPDRAEDLAAEVFLVVWRRFDDVPAAGDARPWIFGIARNLLLNERRGDQRRHALGVRLADALATSSVLEPAEQVTRRVDVARAWQRLSETHQEALALAVFDDLNAPEAAAVLGISPVAFRLRVSRARRALRLHLGDPPRHPRNTSATQARAIAERTP